MTSSKSTILKKLNIPNPTILKFIEGYKLQKIIDNLLDWNYIDNQMMNAKYYWILTTNKSGIPHSVPVWEIWYENRVFFGESPKTKWVRNINVNPYVSVHLQSAEQVCMIEC